MDFTNKCWIKEVWYKRVQTICFYFCKVQNMLKIMYTVEIWMVVTHEEVNLWLENRTRELLVFWQYFVSQTGCWLQKYVQLENSSIVNIYNIHRKNIYFYNFFFFFTVFGCCLPCRKHWARCLLDFSEMY